MTAGSSPSEIRVLYKAATGCVQQRVNQVPLTLQAYAASLHNPARTHTMPALVAVIRRIPGGAFAKVPKSSSMPAMPVQTQFSNFATYLNAWPKHRSEFLMYGHRRAKSTLANDQLDHSLKPGCARAGKTVQAALASDVEDMELQLYGPAPSTGEPGSDAPGAAGCGGTLSGGKSSLIAAHRAQQAPGGTSAVDNSKTLGLGGMMRLFRRGQKLTMITAYDFPSARFARGAAVELVLVGDSLGNCRLGLPDTVGVTMQDMLGATTAVRRGVDGPLHSSGSTGAPGPKPLIVGDMPFGSYLMKEDALRNAAAFRMAGADMVKLEGGKHVAPLIRELTSAGIAVMGHVGLEPQSALLQGGLKMQGTTAATALKIIQDARELVAAGAVAVVIECVPTEVGRAVQAAVSEVPVIGIGAGNMVAGQVLVCDDLLGVHGTAPSFVKQYADVGKASMHAYSLYVEEVRNGSFPGPSHSRAMRPDERAKLTSLLTDLGITEPTAAEPVPSSKLTQGVKAFPSWLGSASARPAHVIELRNGKFVQAGSLRAVSQLSIANGSSLSAKSGNEAQAPAPKILKTRKQLHSWRRSISGRVALVPTMGNLHDGHLELVDEAKRLADVVLVSIFVNPAQFAAHEDLDRYPRTFERDLELLQARGVEAVFAPGPTEMYPSGSPGGTVVVPQFVKGKSEDACRPHFFTGVATVCLKLFNVCEPDVVIFGQKDAMQCAVIAHMLEDLMLDSRISLVVAPTSREADGLALSSRNSYLTPKMRKAAPAIFKALCSATQAPGATPASVRSDVRKWLEQESMEVQYISVADARHMDEKDDKDLLGNSVVSIACLLRDGGQVCRLIDNLIIPETKQEVPTFAA
mmetsp:Transcript_8880/g.15280  ORF Transcript_8880/g.15280 Transcript_8880/m.15280 type:complete len:860 (-) Transcript_8880:78-2657(-)